MALFHRATITPTKEALIAGWVPGQPWGPAADVELEFIGAYRFDDPEGAVGMETFLVRAGDRLLQVPLTYRDAPLDGADGALISTMEHSALGTRWVYDGLGDPTFLVMMTAVAMTGQGEALGLAQYEGRWYIAPSPVRIHGGGWTLERVPVDRLVPRAADAATPVFANDRFELTVFRNPVSAAQPAIGLTATWSGQSTPVVLAEVRQLPN